PATQIDHAIGYDLPWSMIGDLPAPISLDQFDSILLKDVFGLARLAQGINGTVLGQPDFVIGIRGACFGKIAHRRPGLPIRSWPRQPLSNYHAIYPIL